MMRIRRDLLILTVSGLLILLLILYISSRLILLPSYEDLEVQKSQDGLKRVQAQLTRIQASLDKSAVDFADWNDTIAFVNGTLNDYPASNFTNQTFQYLHLNLALILNPEGQVVYGTSFDLSTGKPILMPAGIMTHLNLADRLLDHKTIDSHVDGLFLLPEGPMIIASRPILTSDYQGPIQGTLIFGQFLSKDETDEISKLTGLSLSFHPLNDSPLPPDYAAAWANISQNLTPYTSALDADTIASYSLLSDIYGQPGLLLRVEQARDLYLQGLASLNYFFVWFAVVGLIFSAGIYIAMDRMTSARQARSSAETRFQNIFENALEGIYQSTPDGNVLSVNPAMARILGYSTPQGLVDTITDMPRQIYVHAEDRNKFIQLIEANGIINNFIVQLYRKDASIIWASMSARRVKDTEGNIKYFEGFLQDITEQRQAEEAIFNSEKRFRVLIENGLDNISLIDPNGNLLWESPAVVRNLGYAPDELVKQNMFQLIHPEDFGWAQSVLSSLMTEPMSRHAGIFRLRHKDGTWRWSEAVATNMLDEPSVKAIVINYRDITNRKLAEQAFFDSEARFRSYIEHAPLGIFVIDSSACFTMVNPATSRMLGYSEDELRETSILKVLPAQFIGSGQQLYNQVVTMGLVKAELPVRRRNGQIFWMQTHAVSLGNSQVLAFCQDITELKQAAEKIERQVKHLKALSEIDYTISSGQDLHLSLNTLLSHLNSQLNIDASDVLLLDSDTQILEFTAGKGFRGRSVEKTCLHVGEGYAGRAAEEQKPTWILNLNEHPTSFLGAPRLEGEDFISYFAVPLVAKSQTLGVLEIFHRAPLKPDEEWLNFLNTLSGQAAIAIDNAMLFSNLQLSNQEISQAYEETIEGWSRALDLRDRETEGHAQRVATMTATLARAFGLTDQEIVQIRRGALMHDIGKMGVSDHILLKPGPLTDEEWVSMKKHPGFAYEMLSHIAYLQPSLDIPYCHHEKWDGSGYPRGLKGEHIPLGARLFAVVDVWDALRSDRPYRSSWPVEKVRTYIQEQSGAHFDPQVVKIFLDISVEKPIQE